MIQITSLDEFKSKLPEVFAACQKRAKQMSIDLSGLIFEMAERDHETSSEWFIYYYPTELDMTLELNYLPYQGVVSASFIENEN